MPYRPNRHRLLLAAVVLATLVPGCSGGPFSWLGKSDQEPVLPATRPGGTDAAAPVGAPGGPFVAAPGAPTASMPASGSATGSLPASGSATPTK